MAIHNGAGTEASVPVFGTFRAAPNRESWNVGYPDEVLAQREMIDQDSWQVVVQFVQAPLCVIATRVAPAADIGKRGGMKKMFVCADDAALGCPVNRFLMSNVRGPETVVV